MSQWFECSMSLMVGLCLLISLILIVNTNTLFSPLSSHLKQRGDDDHAIYFHVITIGTLLWPVLWYYVLGFELFKVYPVLFIAFIWPIILGIVQLIDGYYDKCEDIQDHQQQRLSFIGGIHTDTATVISFSFACASLFWAMKNNNNVKSNTLPSAKIIVLALLICVGFIVPTFNFIDNNQQYTTYIRVSQRVFVNYCMSFIMTSLITLVLV